jgi:hypothetical protein
MYTSSVLNCYHSRYPWPRSQREIRQLNVISALRPVFFAAGSEDTVEIELKIEGMMCGGCTGRVEEALKVRAKTYITRSIYCPGSSGSQCLQYSVYRP